MIALVVTIVILIILATVSMNTMFGENGIITAAKEAAIRTLNAQINEYVNMRILENDLLPYQNKERLEFEDLVDRDENSIIDGLIEQGLLSPREDIKIEWDIGQVTIKDPKKGTVTVINETDGVTSDVYDKDTDVSKPQIDYTLNPENGTYAETVIIKLTLKSDEGLSKLECIEDSYTKSLSGDEEIVEYPVTLNGYYTFKVTDENGQTATRVVKISNTMSSDVISFTPSTEDLTNESVQLTINYDPAPEVSGVPLTNANKYEYKIGNSAYDPATNAETTITIEQNTTVYARYNDGTNGFQEVEIAIENIDKIAPTATLTTANTSNSITVNVEATDEGSVGLKEEYIGIKGYKYKIDGGSWSETTQLATNTFTGLTQNKEYTIYVGVEDLAGNVTEQTEKVTTGTVTDATGAITISLTPTAWTQGNVVTTITSTSSLTLQYLVGTDIDGTWTTIASGGTYTFTSNGVINARLHDGVNAGSYVTANINNIDKDAPNTFTVSGTATSNSITASRTTPTDVGTSGINTSTYQYILYTSNQTTVAKTWQATTSFTGLTSATTYYLQGRVYDNAGNLRETAKVAVTTPAVTAATASNLTLTPSTSAWTNGNVTVTLKTTTSLTVQYQIGTTISATGWTTIASGGTYSFTANGTINARLYDGTNGGTYVSLKVENIDKTAPNTFTVSAASKTDSTITATRSNSSDSVSGLNTTAGYQYMLYTSNQTTTAKSWQTGTSFTGLTGSTTYYLQGRVYDNAGNVRETAKVAVTTDTPIYVGEGLLTRGKYVTYNGQTWVVLHGASDSGTNSYVEIYYPSLTATKTISGQSGYCSLISDLNAECSTYSNSTYAQSYRHLGSHPTSPTTNATVSSSSVVYGNTSTMDTHYTTDVTGYNSAGVDNSQGVWLASRHVTSYSSGTNFRGRYMPTSGSTDYGYRLFSVSSSGSAFTYSDTYGLSPVVSLKSTIKITGGSGTSGSPYTLGT